MTVSPVTSDGLITEGGVTKLKESATGKLAGVEKVGKGDFGVPSGTRITAEPHPVFQTSAMQLDPYLSHSVQHTVCATLQQDHVKGCA